MLKILFIYTTAFPKSNSVQKKVTEQIAHLNASTSICRGIFIVDREVPQTKFTEHIDFYKIPPGTWKFFRHIEHRRLRIKYLKEIIRKEGQGYDFFLIRYPMASFSLYSFMLFRKRNFIIEHLTDEVSEIKLYQQQNAFSFTPTSILSYFEGMWYPLLKEFLLRRAINRRAKFLLFNSTEIAERQTHHSHAAKFMIGGDAVNVEQFRLKKINPIKDTLNLIFLKGSSTAADFNGIDRIMKSVLAYNGPIKIVLHVLGNNLVYEKSLLPKKDNRFVLKEAMYHEELDDYFDNMHLGVSTLGLFRKRLQNSTTIKTREYFARGIPFVYAYEDVDMELIPATKNYALQFANDDSLIDMNLIVEFAMKHYANPNHNQEMRDLATKYLSYKVKMERVVQFISDNTKS